MSGESETLWEIRPLRRSDLSRAVRLHRREFQFEHNLSQGLGPNFIRATYDFFLTDPKSFALGAFLNGRLRGYVLGRLGYYVDAINRYPPRLIAAAAAVLRRPSLLREGRVTERLRRAVAALAGWPLGQSARRPQVDQAPSHVHGRTATLASICVDSSCPSPDVSAVILRAAEEFCTRSGMAVLRAGVVRTNRAARFMYTRKGYRLDPILSEGDGLYYFKPLSPPSVCHPQPHVCHVTTAHQPFDTRIFRRECVSLARAGYRVTLIAPHTRDEVVDGVHVVALQREPRVWRRRLVLTRQAATLARAVRADLYHFHDPELIPEMRRLARTTGKPVVWDVHEYYSDAIGYRNSLRVPLVSRLGARWFDRMERDACRRDFAGTVVISEEMAARYRPLGRPCVVSGNFPDLDALPRPTPSQRSPRPLLVSSGAQFGPRGAFAVADAFRIARKRIDCQLAIWGTFHPTTLPDDLRQIALADGAPPNDVWIEGPVPWKTLVGDYLPRAWAGCVLFDVANPNYRRGLPNRFFELWAAGVPLLVTGGTEVARLVAEHGGGVVLPDNSPETLATAFVRLVEDPAAVARAGAEGRHAVESIYNWENSRRQLLSLYEQLGVRPGMGLNRSEPTAKAGSI